MSSQHVEGFGHPVDDKVVEGSRQQPNRTVTRFHECWQSGGRIKGANTKARKHFSGYCKRLEKRTQSKQKRWNGRYIGLIGYGVCGRIKNHEFKMFYTSISRGSKILYCTNSSDCQDKNSKFYRSEQTFLQKHTDGQ